MRVYFSLFFFHQEDVEVNTCRRRAGEDQGTIPVQGEHGTALNQSYSNHFPPFCHIPRGSATLLGALKLLTVTLSFRERQILL